MDVDFETKKKMLFESLESAEKSLEGTSLAQSNRDYSFVQNRHQRKRNRDEYVEKYKHKDSMFKRPDLPINKCLKSRQRPDFEVGSKFTKSSVVTIIFNISEKSKQMASLFIGGSK